MTNKPLKGTATTHGVENTPEPIVRAADGLHALDRAPVNSKIVVTENGAILSDTVSVVMLLKSDPANRLPAGARIQKVSETEYRSEQLNPAEDRAALVSATATEAIDAFLAHFHGVT